MHTTIHMLPLLQQVQAVYPDTIYTKQVSMGVVQQIGIIAGALMTVAVLLLAVTGLLLVWYFRGIYRRVNRLIDHLELEVMPLVRGVSGLTGDLREIVTSVKGEVREVQGTINTVNVQVKDVVHRAQERIHRFESLIDIIEEEAEATVVTVAAAVRGVRTGLVEMFDHFDHFDHKAGDDDGDGDGYVETTYARPSRPSVRSRRNGDADEDDFV